MVIGKRGDEKYYLLISIMLGLIILAISLYFIFQEYFDEDDLNFETCRQSILLRNLGFESDRPITSFLEATKDLTPLKCKNDVVNIDAVEGINMVRNIPIKYIAEIIVKEGDSETRVKMDKDRKIFPRDVVAKVIADKLVQCWYLFEKGEYSLFPPKILDERRDCSVCTRIHFSEKLRSTLHLGSVTMGDYLEIHDLDGNKLSEVERGGSKSFFKFLNTRGFSNKFEFLDHGNWKTGGGQGQGLVDPKNGDVIIGVYFYDNIKYFESLSNNMRYRYSYPFYAQPDVDNVDCAIHSISV